MSPLILALDQGTTSSRALVIDANATIRGVGQFEFSQYFPAPALVEHDPLELWDGQMRAIRAALHSAGVTPQEITAIGITNQRETVMLWERSTGNPIGRAIVWQDRRTADMMRELAQAGHEEMIHRATGLVLDSYFSASKIAWMLRDGGPALQARAQAGEICAGTMDSWLVWQLTDGARHVTDVSNASRTMLMGIDTLAWDARLLELFGIPAPMMAQIVASSGEVARTSRKVFGAEIPIAGLIGDQQAALFGQQCLNPGQAKCTYGTGCFLLANTGHRPIITFNGLLSTVAWRIGNERAVYALEGSVFMGGATIQWLRDGLGMISSSAEVNTLAAQVSDSGGVTLVPAFAGLGAPHWDPAARALIGGLTRGSTKSHIARAALEGIAFQCADLLTAFAANDGQAVVDLRVDGGAAASDLLMQIQSDVSGVAVNRPAVLESTALGAACMAGLATGVWRSTDELLGFRKVDRVFVPQHDATWRATERARWSRAVERSKEWNPT
ncbi:MAG: glycerol kinase GlpK [Planctomycetota bacterium]|nr:glycerol kinase GlpK [Planctomycetota bacterium]